MNNAILRRITGLDILFVCVQVEPDIGLTARALRKFRDLICFSSRTIQPRQRQPDMFCVFGVAVAAPTARPATSATALASPSPRVSVAFAVATPLARSSTELKTGSA